MGPQGGNNQSIYEAVSAWYAAELDRAELPARKQRKELLEFLAQRGISLQLENPSFHYLSLPLRIFLGLILAAVGALVILAFTALGSEYLTTWTQALFTFWIAGTVIFLVLLDQSYPSIHRLREDALRRFPDPLPLEPSAFQESPDSPLRVTLPRIDDATILKAIAEWYRDIPERWNLGVRMQREALMEVIEDLRPDDDTRARWREKLGLDLREMWWNRCSMSCGLFLVAGTVLGWRTAMDFSGLILLPLVACVIGCIYSGHRRIEKVRKAALASSEPAAVPAPGDLPQKSTDEGSP